MRPLENLYDREEEKVERWHWASVNEWLTSVTVITVMAISLNNDKGFQLSFYSQIMRFNKLSIAIYLAWNLIYLLLQNVGYMIVPSYV